MRKQAILLFLAFFLSLASFANRVIIKGTINTPNGAPVVGKTVLISSVQNSNTACNIKDSTKTNPNGYFIDTLQCSGGDIRWVVVAFRNCEGQLVSKTFEVPTSGVIEVKLQDCVLSNTSNCNAGFAIIPPVIPGGAFTFISPRATPGTVDTIVRRVWTFGDGTGNEGNNGEVKKEYKNPGVYEVCLKVTTQSGCTKTTCQRVEFKLPPLVCKAAFAFERIPTSAANAMGFRFISTPSTISAGDEIVSRTWTFGDGSGLAGNEISPVHNYTKAGNYEVCLTIKTKKGCESKTCMVVVAQLPNCKPALTYEIIPVPANTAGIAVRFNSKYDQGIMMDTIISRSWVFGDGKILNENVPNPVHVYEKAGQYKVCLVTKTRLGCVSESCTTINVVAPAPARCEAKFKFERGPENIGYFHAGPSLIAATDAIVKTVWSFGDGQTMTMNGLEAKHQYARAGTYEVCVTIVTKAGCESKWCGKVEIGPATNVQQCGARFTIDNSRPGLVLFNSESSFTQIPEDKIVSRRWDFGNGRVIDGNTVKTEMQYPFGGKFNVCLTIKTAKGCVSKICQTVEVKQGQAPVDSSRLWLVKYYPNPVTTQLFAVVYSPKENVEVEIAVVDVYGIVKSTKKVTVPKGYSTHVMNTQFLLPGPYLLRVRSAYGVQSRSFYKVN
jgi:PKD repeat protein